MSSLTNYLEEKLLKHYLAIDAFSAPSKVYLALGTSAAAETDQTSWSGELSGSGYERQAIAFDAPEVDETFETVNIKNGAAILFGPASVAWNNIEYFAIWDAKSGGNLLAFGTLGPQPSVAANKALEVEARALSVELDGAGVMSQYALEGLVNLAFRGLPFSVPACYFALCTNSPSWTGDESDLQEPSGGYEREACSNWNAITQDAGSAKTTNDGDIDFGPATSDWDLIATVAIVDAASGGNLLGITQGGGEVFDGDTGRLDDAEVNVLIG